MIKDTFWQTALNMLAPAVLSMLVLLACAGGNAVHARNPIPPWCAWDPGISNFNCGFYTHQQCMAAAWGNGGLCVPNSRAAYGNSAAAPPLAILYPAVVWEAIQGAENTTHRSAYWFSHCCLAQQSPELSTAFTGF